MHLSDSACSLRSDVVERHRNVDGATWLVDDRFLEDVAMDLQSIVDCTKEGDVILFNTTGRIRPLSRIIIPWNLTLGTHAENSDSKGHPRVRATSKARFTCPQKNEGLFLLR